MKRENLSPDDIFLKDERFRISYYFSLEKMILSLKEIGLLNPPLVTSRDGHFILVQGWKRILACLHLCFSSLPVFVVEEKDELKTFLFAFYENLATREFSLAEKAEIISRLKKFGEDEKRIVRHYLPLLNIPPTLSYLDSFLAFSQFEPEVKKLIHERNLPFSLVKLLAEFSPPERILFFSLISSLSQSKMMEFLENLKEISIRDGLSVRKILASKETQDILSSERLSSLQKSDKMRLLLKKKRYPALSSWEDSFYSLIKKLNWPKEIVVRPSPFFEEKKISLTFSFENQEEFKSSLLRLQEFASKKEFFQTFKMK